jgi:release factor glutamine methyltransferase
MSAETWTLRRIVRWMTDDFQKRGVGSARLDAELLAAHALGITRVSLFMDLDRPLDVRELEAIRALVPRRRRREPMAYILGRREFWGLELKVGPSVLIPRPETELLVELSLPHLPAAGEGRVLDLCTGSGCVAIAIATERPMAAVVATDLSEDALEVARVNTAAHGVDGRVELVQGDLFGPLAGRLFDVVTANPPYLAARELGECEPDVRDFEPRLALVAGDGGLEIVARIASGLGAHLAPAGRAFVEVGAGQAGAAASLLRERGFVTEIHLDLARIERVVEARRP